MWKDLRYASDGLIRTPGFTCTAVLALGLTIGANAAIFGLVDALWFRPPGVQNPDRLVRVFSTTSTETAAPWSYPEYLDLRDGSESLEGLVARGRRGTVVRSAAGSPELALVNVVSTNFFSVLGVRPSLGRLFAPGDEEQLNAEPGIVLGHSYWQRRFGGDASVAGRTLQIGAGNGLSVVVLGVLPAKFRDLDAAADRDIWMPPQTWQRLTSPRELEDRSFRWFDLVGRRMADSAVTAVQAEIATLAAAMASRHSEPAGARGVRVVGDLSYRLELGGVNAVALLGLVLLVVLITCVNVANLLLARSAARARELALRVALGAGRWRLVRQLLAESTVLGLLGAGAGIITGAWLLRLIPGILIDPPGFRSLTVFEMDGRVLTFTLAVTVMTTVLFGVVPSWIATRTDPAPLIKGATGSSGFRREDRLVRTGLLTAQIAVSVVLLCAAGVLARSFAETRRADLGFSRQPLLTAWVSHGDISNAVLVEAVERLERLPGVRRVATAIRAPLSLSGGGMARVVHLPDSAPGSDPPIVKFNAVSTNFFETFGTRLRAGRAFTEADQLRGPAVVIVNEQFARQFFPSGDALGRTVRVGGPQAEPHQIIGIAQNAVINEIGEPPEPYFYLPFWRGDYGEVTFILDSAADPGGLAQPVRTSLIALDPGLEPRRLLTMAQYIEYSGSTYRATAVLAATLGAIGLLLTALGVYGVVAYRTFRRRREFGIRIALGAGRTQVLRLVLAESGKLAALGLVLGIPSALATTNVINALLFGVSPSDPVAFVVAPVVIAGAVLLASLLPALRATRVSPSTALRDV